MTIPTLEGRTALVTGSTSGIGRAIALAMREAGASVIFHSQDPEPEGLPEDAPYLRADLFEIESPRDLMDAAFEIKPELDLLVCNAGGFFDTPFIEMTSERWQRTIDLNLRAGYFLVQSFARRLTRERRRGSVVFVASTNGFQAEYDSTAYDTSKGGVVMMTRTLALALAGDGIRVNAIAPGLIRTPGTEPMIGGSNALSRHYEKNIPMGRIGMPEDCAGAAIFLASSAADYMTGQTLVIDGGLTVQQIGK